MAVNTIDILGDDDLFELLLDSPASELGELVDNLGRGSLTMHTAVKQLFEESKLRGIYMPATIRIMINELQRFGGNTVTNTVQGKGVSYAEIVTDVLKHLGGAVDDSVPTSALELVVVNARLGRYWPGLSDAEKQEYLSELDVSRTTLCELSDLQDVVLRGGHAAASIARRLARLAYVPTPSLGVAGFVALGTLVNPFLGALATTGAAYRVTVPCVLQVAHLRQRKIAGALSSEDEIQDELLPVGNRDPLGRTLGSHPRPSRADLVICSDQQPIVSVSSLSPSESVEAQKLPSIEVPGIDRLAPLIQSLPSLAVGADVAANRYVKVLVNGPLAAAADGDGLRGFVRGSDGKLVEQARFYEDGRLTNIVNGALLFQIASVALAQKHLADISRKLDEIKEGVERIHEFQINERKAGVVGRLKYLKQIAPVILGGSLSRSARNRLEECELSLGIVQSHICEDLAAMARQVSILKDPGKLGGDGLTSAIQERQERFGILAEQWRLCLAARQIACRLVYCYPTEKLLVKQRSNDLNQIADDMLGAEGLVKQFTDATATRSKALDGHFFGSQIEVRANYERLRLWEVDSLKGFERGARTTICQLDSMLKDNMESVALVLEMQSDKVVRVMAEESTLFSQT